MNAVDPRPPYTANTSRAAGIGDYIFIVGFVFSFVLLVTIAYAFYMCRRSRLPPPPTISFVSTTYDGPYDHHLITVSPGVDDDILVTFPTFVFSEATVPHKGGTTDDANDSGCSICLADYKPAELVRLLPECGHCFHVECIDMWLKGHSTCPVCRKSAIARTDPLPVQQS